MPQNNFSLDTHDLLKKHKQLMDSYLESTQRLLQFSKENEAEKVADEAENRERILNIVIHIQDKIDQSLKQYADTGVPPETIESLRNWKEKFQYQCRLAEEYDEQVVECLSQLKDGAKQDINKSKRSRKNLQKYNLNDVRK
jgi:hypothetical protein